MDTSSGQVDANLVRGSAVVFGDSCPCDVDIIYSQRSISKSGPHLDTAGINKPFLRIYPSPLEWLRLAGRRVDVICS